MDAGSPSWSADRTADAPGAVLGTGQAGHAGASRSMDCVLTQTDSDTAVEDWREINRQIADVDLDAGARSGFQAQITARHLGRSVAMRVRSVAQTSIRNRAVVRVSGIDHIAVTVLEAGHAVGEFQGRLAEVSPGDVFCVDYAKEFRLRFTDFAETVLVVPRRFLPKHIRSASLHGLVMPGDKASTRLLAAHLMSLTELAVDLTPEAAAVGVEAAFLLIQGARGRADAVHSPLGDGNQALLREVLDFIDARITDQSLGYDLVMDRFKLSKSTLYRLFKDTEGVNAYIVGRRLDACHDDLARDGTGTALIGQVAFSYGFLSQSHFTRQFKKRFGVSPRHVRGMAVTADGADRAGQRPAATRSRPADILNDWLRFSDS